MKTDMISIDSMREDMKTALQKSNAAPPKALSKLFDLLSGAQEALRVSGYAKAVLELRQGLQTSYGLRYTAYLRDETSAFEHPLFSAFIDAGSCTFQAEGQIIDNLDAKGMLSLAREYLLRQNVIEFMTGLLRQFGRGDSVPALNIPSTSQ